MVKLWLTDHFKFRMMERGVDINHVKRAVKSPDFTTRNADGSVLVRKKIDAKRIIEVVYRERVLGRKQGLIMITAYYLLK